MIILFLFITFILLLANDPLRPTQYFVDSFSFVPSITYRQRALPCTFRRSTTVRSSSFSLTGYEPNPLYDENPPLANGIDSVKWMEPCDVTARRESAKEFLGQSGGASISPLDSYSKSEIIPLFPLSGMVYTPYTSHVLNIFEPRYRAMYSDILLNGTRRFVVTMSHPEKPGCFASTGVIFYLKDLKEVSQQTEDQIKYICEHEVIGRVEMTKVLNPAVWGTRDTYLKVEGKILEEDSLPLSASSLSEKEKEEITQSGADTQNVFMVGSMEEEASLRRSFAFLVDLQHELNEDVRFTRKSVPTLGVGPGGEKGSLWSTVRLWQSYTEQRLVGRQNELQLDFQEKLVKFLTEDKDVKEDELPSAIGFSDLSPQLQRDVQDLQQRMSNELEPLVLESTLTMQKILEAPDHAHRANLLRYFVDLERKRLEAKRMLKTMFTGVGGDKGDKGQAQTPLSSQGIDEGEQQSQQEEDNDAIGGVDFEADDGGFE